MQSDIPELRVRTTNEAEVRADRQYVLYWMIANRRTRWNYSLDRAVEWAQHLDRPLVIFEALRVGYRWASDRLHTFIIQGMRDNAAALVDKPVTYYPYLEPKPGKGSGLLEGLAAEACVVVTDDFPCFFLPRMVAAVADRLGVRLESVDSNGLLPLRAAEKVYSRAVDFRRFLQKELRPHLAESPKANPVSRIKLPQLKSLPKKIRERWPAFDPAKFLKDDDALGKLPIDHEVRPSPIEGGHEAARRCLDRFIDSRLDDYADGRNHPDDDKASGFSPYLHFGHLSAHEAFQQIMRHDGWTPGKLADKATASREGWWGASEAVEAFLDELITWRELGYNMCWQQDDYDQLASLPDWAKQTIKKHAQDDRPHVYSLQELESAATHDRIWNAAQNELVQEGRMHNYLRMLWGKKIYQWSESAEDALAVMIELNNKYALDGRNPNSYSGIFWVLGRYDRAWGPEREIFGKLRYMTSESTKRKLRLDDYLEKYAPE